AFHAVMRVPVDHEVGTGVVDGLAKEVAAEEREDLLPFAGERVLHRRVMEQSDAEVGVELVERARQPVREPPRMADERPPLPLAPVRRDRPPAPPPKPPPTPSGPPTPGAASPPRIPALEPSGRVTSARASRFKNPGPGWDP